MKRCLHIAVAFWVFNWFLWFLAITHPEYFPQPLTQRDFYTCMEVAPDGSLRPGDACTEPLPELPVQQHAPSMRARLR